MTPDNLLAYYFIHQYRIVQFYSFALYFLNSASKINFRLVDAFDFRPARATRAFRGLIRSIPVQTPTQTEIQTKIMKDKIWFDFEAFWSDIAVPGCGWVLVDHDSGTLRVANLSQRMPSLGECAPDKIVAWLVNEGAMVLWREMASKSHVCWNAARVAREAWESSVKANQDPAEL